MGKAPWPRPHAARQATVHTHERYVAVFLAEGLSLAEAIDRTAIFVERHKAGNLVGKESSAREGAGQACHALRKLGDPITFKYSVASAPTRVQDAARAHGATLRR